MKETFSNEELTGPAGIGSTVHAGPVSGSRGQVSPGIAYASVLGCVLLVLAFVVDGR
jgi:hypothetical protein